MFVIVEVKNIKLSSTAGLLAALVGPEDNVIIAPFTLVTVINSSPCIFWVPVLLALTTDIPTVILGLATFSVNTVEDVIALTIPVSFLIKLIGKYGLYFATEIWSSDV